MSQTKRRILFRPASVLLLGALAMLLAQSAAHAEILSISGGDFQAIGDAAGTNIKNTATTPGVTSEQLQAGQGLPTAAGGWPSGPGFAGDTSFPPGVGGAQGISGFDNFAAPGTSALSVSLDHAGPVAFTYFGRGDASFINSFRVDGQTVFTTNSGSSSSNQGDTRIVILPAGPLSFSWMTPQGVTVSNNSLSTTGNPGFFAGVDPYQASTTFQRTSTFGGSVYLGLTDRITPPGTEADHDYQDLTVKITAVPEPASLITGSTAALIIGFACAWSRRRKRASA